MLELESRRLMAAVALPYKLDFSSAISGTTVDKDGQGTGFQTAQAGSSSQVDINTTKGTLALTADYTSSKPTAALETAFDGTTRGFTVTSRLIGPLSNLLKSGDQAGMYFGPDLNNCVRLTAVYMSGVEYLQLATIVNGKYVAAESSTYFTLPVKFSQIATLDLQLTGDAVTGQMSARYRINDKSWTRLGSNQVVPTANKAAFFNSASETGVIVSNKRGPITATFDSFSIDAGITAVVPVANISRTLAAFSDLTTTSGSSNAQTVRIVNTGEGDLVITGLTITGDNASEFTVTNPLTSTLTLKTGERYDFYVVFKTTTTTANAIRSATLTFATNDPSGASTSVALRGLGLAGLGGTYEPALQRIIDVYGFKTQTNQSTTSNAFDSSITSADEVTMPQITKAGSGNVTIEMLGVFANQISKTTIGWYEAGNPQTTYLVGGVSASDAQSIAPLGDGMLSFDPGSNSFGLYGNFTLGSASKPINRNVYSEDSLNTWETNTAKQKKVRFYKLRDANGNVVENAYIVTFEEYNVTFDQNDIVAIVRNVKPAAVGPELGLENLDGAPAADQLVMSRVDHKDPNLATQTDHDTVTLRIRNTGSQPLTISGMVLSDANFQIISGGDITSIAAGGYADIKVKFVYSNMSATSGNKVIKSTLTLKTNDADEPTKTVKLSGIWQSYSENAPNGQSAEPTAEQIIEAFGYGTTISTKTSPINTKGVATASGDEVLSELWQRADTGLPVTVRMLATYHQVYNTEWNTHSTLYTYDPTVMDSATGKPKVTKLLSHEQEYSQSVLPTIDGSMTNAAVASWIPTMSVFGFNIDGQKNGTYSQDVYNTPNDASNPGHGWRFYVAKDANGNIIPDTYIACQDYVKVSWANYDYQDNILIITNVKPVSAPQIVQQVTATGTSTGVTVAWKANTANDITSYNVWRRVAGTSDSFVAVANVAGTSYADTTAVTGTKYEYYVTAVAYQGGQSTASATASATAGSGTVSTPTAASGVLAKANSATSVTVTWADNSSTETGFRIERKTVGGTWATVGTVAANVLTFTDGTTSATTSYTYRVIAVNAAGDSASSNESTVTTPAVTPTTPVALTSVDIGSPTPAGQVTTVTTGRDYNVSVGGVDIYNTSDSFNFLYQQKTGDFDVAVKINSLTGADPSTQAGLMVRESLAANSKNINIKAQLKGLRLTYRTSTGGSTTATGSGDFTGQVYLRLQRVGSTFTTYTSTDGVNWTQFGSLTLSLGSTLYVGLATCGKSQTTAAAATYRNFGDTGSTTNTGGTTTTPNAASSLVASAQSATSVALSWADNSSNETGFRIERQTGSGSWTTVATVAANTTGYTDTTASANTTYNYRVVATGSTDAAASNTASATTPPSVGTNLTLAASKDTYVYDGATTANYGTATGLQIKKGSTGYNRQALVTFDISSLTSVSNVTLKLYTNLNTADTVQTAVYGIGGTWTESGVTWATKPVTGNLIGTFVTSSVTAAWVEVDVTAYVKAAIAAGQTTVSFSLQGTASSTAYTTVASRESGNGPQLVIG
ncbi:MAG: DNRLRE domain-containing protein [Tepidisphaeraceae bacterium]